MGRIDIATVLANNEQFQKDLLAQDPKFFANLASSQHPEVLYIGCADSRCPADQYTQSKPGDLFETRNIANVVIHSDLNCMSVIEYAVKYLKVKRIVVCGHYGCGGVAAAMGDHNYGSIDNWLRHIKDTMRNHQESLSTITDGDLKFRRMCELNALESMHNVCSSVPVQNAWKEGQELSVHAMIYDVATGELKDLKAVAKSNKDISPIYAYNKA
eukprot:CAMPEP_0184699004 /NCGR_PEP_ID=MMETSP0313-20130426/5417_1 /TAXON_ID=2792 /ORGANISM="Porphyridium aerugineum, Strain SAG 1380-2" /LENGTH=213 /DNA_ID=CAMNT_0027158021 /DNA_START=250 /DNA_END=891 /DNA_ORIENTATION=+